MKKFISTGLLAIALPVISLIFCLIFVEVMGRATGLLVAPSRLGRFSPTKGYELSPGYGGINSYGLRDREFHAQKPPDTYRIVALGDSFTYGQGVSSAETYVKQLEALLNTNASGNELRYEVINAGVPGYNTQQEFIHFNEVARQFHPDLLLLQFTLNDAEQGAFGMKDSRRWMWLIRIKEWIKEHFALYSTIRVHVLRLIYRVEVARLGVEAEDISIRPLKLAAAGQITSGWESCRKALGALASAARVLDVPILLVIYPLMQNLDETYPYKPVHGLIADTGRDYGMVVVDLLGDFTGREPETLWVSPEDRHPNRSAHTVAANSIYRFLISHKLIPHSTWSRQLVGVRPALKNDE